MDKNTFLDLDLEDQVKYLNDLLDGGKSIEDTESDLGLDRRELGKLGLYFVRDRFMGKPMRGYQTAKRSGNEHAKFDGAKIEEGGKGAVL